jgi:hypothetical protein
MTGHHGARRRPLLVASAWLAALGAVGAALVRLGTGRLALPPLRQPGAWVSWAETTGPIDSTFALLRGACLVGVAYLGLVVLVGLAAELSGARPLLRLSEAISIGLVRRLVHGTLGLGVTVGALAGTTSVLAATPAGASAVALASATGANQAGSPMAMRAAAPSVGPAMRVAAGARPVDMRTAPTSTPVPTMRADGTSPAVTTRGQTSHVTMRAEATASTPVSMRADEAAPTVTMRVDHDPLPLTMRADRPGDPLAMRPGQAGERPGVPISAPLDMRPDQASAAPRMHVDPADVPATVHADRATGQLRMRIDHQVTDDQSIPEPVDAPIAAPLTERVLTPGDHLWSVAEQQVEAVLGRPATDEEITRYWRRVLEVNRASLADPANPDLVFSGQVIVLPPL